MSEQSATLGHHDRAHILVERMAAAASDWLASLSTDQRKKAVYDFPANEQRTLWFYFPIEQGGLPLAEMDPIQQRLAHRLIATGLSLPGYVVAATIMGLENVLDRLEDWQMGYPHRPQPNRGRDPQLYFVTIFGDPGSKSWGWRVGGHHLNLHYTIVDGYLASPTPLFFGANPAESPLVGLGVLRPLAGEEDLGRELLHALDRDQLAVAILTPGAPTDILQRNSPNVETGVVPRGLRGIDEHDDSAERHLEALRHEHTPKGLSAARMTPAQREVLVGLLRQYVDRLPEEIASIHTPRVTGSALDEMHFAWAGGRERGQPHYYRIQGPRLLVEYDNTQNDTNHIHAVWRDPEGDFGVDLLGLHYRHAH